MSHDQELVRATRGAAEEILRLSTDKNDCVRIHYQGAG